MCSKVNLAFSDISVWARNFWKTFENAGVDGERFEMKNAVFINVDVAQVK